MCNISNFMVLSINILSRTKLSWMLEIVFIVFEKDNFEVLDVAEV